MSGLVGQMLKGSTKSITVEEDAITISYRVLYHGFKGDKRIPISSITAVQYKEPSGWLVGYIQFSIHGGVEWLGPVAQDENALQFDKKDADAFRALRNFVQDRIGKGGQKNTGASIADELAKLAALKEQGILTEDEFIAQKAKLLS
ncbi:MAG: DUF4429 domain-containing protein [Sphingobium sp.]